MGKQVLNYFHRASVVFLSLTLLSLTGCLYNERAVFEDKLPSTPLKHLEYIVTDGMSTLGRLSLSEENGIYKVVESVDGDPNLMLTHPKIGQSFQLFQATVGAHPVEERVGNLEYYWLQAQNETGSFTYELLGIAQDSKLRAGVVFRWGYWTKIADSQFQDALDELMKAHPELLTCSERSAFTMCTVSNLESLTKIADVAFKMNLSPIRAYVPKPN